MKPIVRELVAGKSWEVAGATRDEAFRAVRNALDQRTPIRASGLPGPVVAMMSAMVGAWTSDRSDARAGTVSKVHHFGDSFYNTTFTVREAGGRVRIDRHTQGVLGAGAAIGNFGAAFQLHLDQLRRGGALCPPG